jgi:hypothetical protein
VGGESGREWLGRPEMCAETVDGTVDGRRERVGSVHRTDYGTEVLVEHVHRTAGGSKERADDAGEPPGHVHRTVAGNKERAGDARQPLGHVHRTAHGTEALVGLVHRTVSGATEHYEHVHRTVAGTGRRVGLVHRTASGSEPLAKGAQELLGHVHGTAAGSEALVEHVHRTASGSEQLVEDAEEPLGHVRGTVDGSYPLVGHVHRTAWGRMSRRGCPRVSMCTWSLRRTALSKTTKRLVPRTGHSTVKTNWLMLLCVRTVTSHLPVVILFWEMEQATKLAAPSWRRDVSVPSIVPEPESAENRQSIRAGKPAELTATHIWSPPVPVHWTMSAWPAVSFGDPTGWTSVRLAGGKRLDAVKAETSPPEKERLKGSVALQALVVT